MRIPKDCVVSPELLRQLADQIEERQAYAELTFEYNDESYKPDFLGMDGYGRPHRRWVDKSMTIKFDIRGPVEVQGRDGIWRRLD
jgi:hypothetical protein